MENEQTTPNTQDGQNDSSGEVKNQQSIPDAPTQQPKISAPETKPPQPTTEPSTPAQQKKSSGNGTAVIVVILAILVLGAGGYYYSKYVQKKNSDTEVTANTSVTASAGTASVESIISSLLYPKATIADQKQDSASAYKAQLTLNTPDNVPTIKDYYLKLAKTKSWAITRQGTVGDNNFYLTVTDSIFEAEIEITKYEGYDTTDIGINISGESLISTGILVSPTTSATSATATASVSTTAASSGDYVISDSDTRAISKSDLINLTPWQLKVARNEIYARRGREFVHKDLQCYFDNKSWYEIDPDFNESSLSAIENKNVATIKAYEDETSSPLASKDSGCNTN